MTSGPNSPLLRFIRKIAAARPSSESSDGALLQRFVAERDEAAFAVLVRRHGPMVLGVCRGVLGDADDADDVFQATFLVLVRKARSIGKPDSLGSWLHGVAYRLALKARGAAARRREQERQASSMSGAEPDHEAIWRDLRPVLHDEVHRLPERYRKPFVLCYLEGRTNEEAADILGWPKGTVLSSLSRARERLRHRLTQRGIALSAGLLATILTEKAAPAAVPAVLLDATIRAGAIYAAAPGAATGAIAAPVLAYVEDLARTMALARLKLAAVLLLSVATLGVASGVALFAHRPVDIVDTPPAPPPALQEPAVEAEVLPLPKPPRPDRELLNGAWVVVSGAQLGRPLADLNESRLRLTADDFVMNVPRGEVRWIFRRGETRGQFKLQEHASPRQIDLIDKNRTLLAIYALEGDTLRLCVADPDAGERPQDFTTRPADRQLLLILQRR